MASEGAVQNPRLIVAGDIIIPKGRQKPEIVRGVSFIVHMADGSDVTYDDDDDVRLAPDGSETVTMQQVKEAKQRELDEADAAIEREQKHLAALDERMRTLEDLRAQREERERRISEETAAAEGE